ncbi:MAG TPA: orotate phosphoribosyltransferase [Nitrospiria bacterium]
MKKKPSPSKKPAAGLNRSRINRLRRLIKDRSFRISPRPKFRLSSGVMSRYYVNCKLVTLDAKGAALIGGLVYDRIKSLKPDGVGGLSLGADPIAVSVAATSASSRHPIPAFIVRKEPKGHGSRAWIEGGLARGAKVVVVEDVMTTGKSTLQAVKRLRAHGCRIIKVLALVDRLEGGREKIEARGIPVEALFTITDFLPSGRGV